MHATRPDATPNEQKRMDDELYRHRVATTKRQLCDPKISTYIAFYEGQPAAFAMWALYPGSQNPNYLPHRLRQTSLYEKALRVWYKVVDYLFKWVPVSVQTAIWFPTIGPLYLTRRNILMQRQAETIEKFIAKEDQEQGYKILYILATLSEYERKGIGSKLLKQGLEEAKEDHASVYLGATPAGKPLYTKNGFEVVGVDVKGEEGVCTWDETLMRWRSP